MKKLIVLFIALLLFLCGCDFLSDTSSSSSSSSSSTVTTHDLTVKYEVSDNYGIIVGEACQSVTVDIGAEHTFGEVTAQANEGYYFVSWSDGKTEPTRIDTVSESITLSAIFAPNGMKRLEYIASAGGTVSGEALQLLWPGQTGKQVSAIPNDGYVFIGWSDGIERANRTDVANSSILVTAKFKKGYWIDFVCDGNEGKILGNTHQALEMGQKTTPVTATAKPGYRFVKWSTGETNPTIQIDVEGTTSISAIYERLDLEIPAMWIVTESGGLILDGKYEDCAITIANTDEKYTLNNFACEMRTRGNTSAQVEKRSYKLKLDKPIALFGNDASREWTLISNHFDLSLIRNYLAYNVASGFDKLGSSSSTHFVDLYMNGEYRGVYLVCDQVEIAPGRVEVETDLTNVDTGYLIELDDRLDGYGFYVNGQFYGIKDPNQDAYNFTKAHTEFIQNYVQECMNALYGNDWDKIESLIDTESFAQAYIVFELFKCVDVGFSSFFMHKDAGGKMVCGPVWDFDRSVGNVSNNYSSRSPEGLYARYENSWFSALFRHSQFKDLVATQLAESKTMIENTIADCIENVYACEMAFSRNFVRWNLLGKYVYPQPTQLNNFTSWKQHVEFDRDWLTRSLAYLLNYYK